MLNSTYQIFKKNKNLMLLLLVFSSNYTLYISPFKLIKISIIPNILKFVYIFGMPLFLVFTLIYIKKENLVQKLRDIKEMKYVTILLMLIIVKTIIFQVYFMIKRVNIGSILSLEDSMKIFFSLLIFIFIYIYSDTFENLKKYFVTLLVSLFIPTIILLILEPQLIGLRLVEFKGIIFDGGLWNASNITFLTTFWLTLFFYKQFNNKYIKTFFIVVIFITILLGITGRSRTIILTILISSLPVITEAFKKRENIKKNAVFTSIVILIAVYFIFKNEIDYTILRFRQLFQPIHFKNQTRIKIWSSYLLDIKNYFMLGYFESDILSLHNGYNPHNLFLNYLIRFGVISIIYFISILKSVFKKGVELKNPLIIASLIVYFINALLNQTGYIQPSFYIQLALIGNMLKFNKIIQTNNNSIFVIER